MKKILYACRDIKYAVRGLEFLLSNKDIVLKGCLISQECDTIRNICRKKDIQIYDCRSGGLYDSIVMLGKFS